jgi:hypothetical protein
MPSQNGNGGRGSPWDSGDPSCRNLEQKARKHVLAEAILVGVYER